MLALRCWLLLAAATGLLAQNEENDDCRTTEGIEGTCILVENCPELYAELTQAAPGAARRDVQNKLRRLTCGYRGRQPLICCARSVIITTRRPTPAPIPSTPPLMPFSGVGTYSEPPPVVSNHPNVRLLTESCGESNDNRIIQGNVTALYEFPWMALISYRRPNGLSFQCGGSIINSRYILTAAHCITQLRLNEQVAGVRVGEHNINTDQDCEGPASARYCAEPVQDIAVEQLIPHPGYTRQTLQHDVGLIRLASEISFNANALPVCLPITPDQSNLVMETRNFTVTGWGATETGESSPVLLKVSLPVITNEQCGRIHNRSVAAGIWFRQVCAGSTSSRADSCGGDSGGPMQILVTTGVTRKTFQYGIVSFGPVRCGSPGIPAVYTRVPHYMDWILDTIRE